MANYKIDPAAILAPGARVPAVKATGEAADENPASPDALVFQTWREAKAAALWIIDQEILRLRHRRAELRALKERDAQPKA
jgi:hypothetical protein